MKLRRCDIMKLCAVTHLVRSILPWTALLVDSIRGLASFAAILRRKLLMAVACSRNFWSRLGQRCDVRTDERGATSCQLMERGLAFGRMAILGCVNRFLSLRHHSRWQAVQQLPRSQCSRKSNCETI
jgi:hypothetical protein